jgi:hypothetical protein
VTAINSFAMFEVGEFTGHGDLKFGSYTHLLNVVGRALCLSGCQFAAGAVQARSLERLGPLLGHC